MYGCSAYDNLSFKSVGDLARKHILKPAGSLELSSSFIDSGHDRDGELGDKLGSK